MAFTQDELDQIKRMLSYGTLTTAAIPYFDIARVFEDIIQPNVGTWGENYIRGTILPAYSGIDDQIAQMGIRAQATELIGDVRLDAMKELKTLKRMQRYWVRELQKIIPLKESDVITGGNARVEVY